MFLVLVLALISQEFPFSKSMSHIKNAVTISNVNPKSVEQASLCFFMNGKMIDPNLLIVWHLNYWWNMPRLDYWYMVHQGPSLHFWPSKLISGVGFSWNYLICTGETFIFIFLGDSLTWYCELSVWFPLTSWKSPVRYLNSSSSVCHQ